MGTLLRSIFPPVPPCLSTVLSIECAMCPVFSLPCGSLWLGCQDFPPMGAVSIQELAANSGNSWISQAPNLNVVRQLLICTLSPLSFQEHNGRVFRLQFDDFQIVSSSHDDTILMWDFLNYSPDQNGKGTVTTLR